MLCSFHLIIGGDFNCCLNPIDIENGVGFNHKRCSALQDLVQVSRLVDAFRHSHPNSQEFTFFQPGCSASRIDRFYVSSPLTDSIQHVSHIPSLSDHCGVKLNIILDFNKTQVPPKKHYASYWKLNIAILQEPDFLPCFKLFWKDIIVKIDSFPNIATWWDDVALYNLYRTSSHVYRETSCWSDSVCLSR